MCRQFVALRTKDLKASTQHYEALGMRVLKVQDNSKKLQSGGSWGVSFASEADAFEPDREQGSLHITVPRGLAARETRAARATDYLQSLVAAARAYQTVIAAPVTAGDNSAALARSAR